MKFETKMAKLNIDENEVKSIIGACECGEVNGAYFLDLSKMRRWEIFETIGNYFNMEERNDYVEETDWTDIKRMSTFCKTFGIEESEIPSYYVAGFNEGGCDIAYTLESNEDVILVLTDDERYHNSFIKYSPSQQDGETSSPSSENLEAELEQVTAQYDAKLEELTQLDSEVDVYEICTDKVLMAEYESKKEEIEKEISEIEDKIEEINEKMEAQTMIENKEYVLIEKHIRDGVITSFDVKIKGAIFHIARIYNKFKPTNLFKFTSFVEFAEDGSSVEIDWDTNVSGLQSLADKMGLKLIAGNPLRLNKSHFIEKSLSGDDA